MIEYQNLLRNILENGDLKGNRTETRAYSIFGTQSRYDLRKGFPAVTTKRLALKAVVSELLWFLEGSGDERRLAEILHGTRDPDKKTIWTENANADYWTGGTYAGDLGRVYGVQWRSWQYFSPLAHSEGSDDLKVGQVKAHDQLEKLINDIKTDPFGRRHILTAWNPTDLPKMALPPCHLMAQFYVSSNQELSCQMYQRSADAFLGVPFNIASYALLTHMVAQVCDLKVGDFIHTIGDAHIYEDHVEQVKEQLTREPLPLPDLALNKDIKEIDGFSMSDITLNHYQSWPPIKAKMAV
jgi:thymidylate synthase